MISVSLRCEVYSLGPSLASELGCKLATICLKTPWPTAHALLIPSPSLEALFCYWTMGVGNHEVKASHVKSVHSADIALHFACKQPLLTEHDKQD